MPLGDVKTTAVKPQRSDRAVPKHSQYPQHMFTLLYFSSVVQS